VITQYTATPFQVYHLPPGCACRRVSATLQLYKCAHSNAFECSSILSGDYEVVLSTEVHFLIFQWYSKLQIKTTLSTRLKLTKDSSIPWTSDWLILKMDTDEEWILIHKPFTIKTAHGNQLSSVRLLVKL